MIPLRDQELLRLRFAQDLTSRVRIDLFTQRPSPIIIPGRPECPFCEDARVLMGEIASLSPRISLTRHEFSESAKAAADLGVDKLPGIVLRGATNRPLRFFGMPTGAQLPAFIELLVEISRGETGLDAAAERQLKKLRDEVKLQVLVAPSCTHSPNVARAAFRFALHNAKVKTDVIEAIEFPALAERYRLYATPTVIIDDKLALVGAMDEASLVDCILRTVEGKPLREGLEFGPSTPFGQPEQEEVRTGPGGLIIPR